MYPPELFPGLSRSLVDKKRFITPLLTLNHLIGPPLHSSLCNIWEFVILSCIISTFIIIKRAQIILTYNAYKLLKHDWKFRHCKNFGKYHVCKKLLQQLASSGEPTCSKCFCMPKRRSRCQCFKNENQRNAHFAAKRPRRPQDIFIEMSKLGRIHCHTTSECLDMYFKYFCGTEMLSADNPRFTKERNDYL